MFHRRLTLVSVFLTLALVLSLVGGSLTFPQATRAANLNAQFVVPTPDDDHFLPVCQNFTIRVLVGAAAQPETNVTATIALVDQDSFDGPGSAELVSGDRVQGTPYIPPGGSWNPQWVWHCTGVGPVEFLVTVASDNYSDPGIEISRGFNQGKPHLVANITAPRDRTVFTPCTNFTVTATLTNTGDIVAEGVTATLGIQGNASLVNDTECKAVGEQCQFAMGDGDGQCVSTLCIFPQDSAQVSWRLHCDGPGNVVLTVSPNGWMSPGGEDTFYFAIYPDNLEDGNITVIQILPPERRAQIGGLPESSPCADIPGCPVCFTPAINIMPREVRAGQPVTIAVGAQNNCEMCGKFLIPLTINGKVEQTQSVEISPHGSYPVQFTVVKSEPGTYTVNFDNYKASFEVAGSADTGKTTSNNWVIPAIAFGLLAVVAVVIVMLVRRRTA